MKCKMLGLAMLVVFISFAQQNKKASNPVYVDKEGVLRWTATKREAQFFGVNYTVPFAYGYRSHKTLGIDPEKAIDADVAHLARLGLDAFRVHVWDTEISDSAGNLLQNEHLRLFDYLLMRLKEHKIKILITPLAFWGNGYPEPDQNTESFSSIWNKRQVLVTEAAIKAQERYLQQFFRHINPYTQNTYGLDPDVIAMEINNEPHHSGPNEGATAYINRMAAAVRSTGWTKPIFYNISESPAYADAVVKSAVDGHSFQWYPTGLVANKTLEGNFLPHVDQYLIPFTDTIPAFAKRARMVYEFDAGDVIGSYMYPAMARSFRQAGFQWATQFAYDPLYTAHANTEYQTHYLNLAYTPSKALSLMIAARAFYQLPRNGNFGTYPADTLFGAFRVSYKRDLSEMNTPDAFYYSNNTDTKPAQPKLLKHIAGVGSSPIVQYGGTGAYFLDKKEEGVWRLEVLPDVFELEDPFGKAAPQRPVRRLLSKQRIIKLQLPGLEGAFTVIPKSGIATQANGGAFAVAPGIYHLIRPGGQHRGFEEEPNEIQYPVEPLSADSVLLTHKPVLFATAGVQAQIKTEVAGSDSVFLELRHSVAGWKTIPLACNSGFGFSATLPGEIDVPGILQYRFLVRDKMGNTHVFPGGATGDPFRWDAPAAQMGQTTLLPPKARIVLFDAAADRDFLHVYTQNWQAQKITYQTGNEYPYVWQVLETNAPAENPTVGWQLPLGAKLATVQTRGATGLMIKAKGSKGTQLNIILVDKEAAGFAATIALEETSQWHELHFAAFKPARQLLLPRPYPGFQPLYFSAATARPLQISNLDKLQIWITATANGENKKTTAAIQTIMLQ